MLNLNVEHEYEYVGTYTNSARDKYGKSTWNVVNSDAIGQKREQGKKSASQPVLYEP